MDGEWWCWARGFERPVYSVETLELLQKTRAGFARMACGLALIPMRLNRRTHQAYLEMMQDQIERDMEGPWRVERIVF